MKNELKQWVDKGILEIGLPMTSFSLEHPAELSHGDYATNVALVLAKQVGKSPKEVAEIIVSKLEEKKPDFVDSISIAGAGFINFHLSKDFFRQSVQRILIEKDSFGTNESLKGRKVIVEYTDANPFKELHVGHLMSNAIGEALSRIVAAQGAEVKRACYSGDKGMHVAKAVAHALKTGAEWKTVHDIAMSYAEGAKYYETDGGFKMFAVEINKKIYNETDEDVNGVYMLGRRISIEYLESMYKEFGTSFDFFFYESTTGEFGKALVHKHTPGIFEESEGAIVFKGEARDPKLHTRVFINKDGIQTYEAKELGLAKIKYDTYPYDTSIVITGNEVNDYFRVLMMALKEIFPELAEKTLHIGHGMMRSSEGKKLSSRSGSAPAAESLIDIVKEKVKEKMKSGENDLSSDEGLVSAVAFGAIKYSILRQAPGRDVSFDPDSATSFEGDSGPYLQYTNARIHSLLQKGKEVGLAPTLGDSEEITVLEKTLYRFPEIVERAHKELAPHCIATYLTEIAATFNAYYANDTIVDEGNTAVSKHRLALSQAVSVVMENGLSLLGMKFPHRM